MFEREINGLHGRTYAMPWKSTMWLARTAVLFRISKVKARNKQNSRC